MLLPLLPIILLLPLSTCDVEGDDVAALAVAASAASCRRRRRCQRRHRRRRRLTLTLPIILLLPLSTRNVEGNDVAALAVAALAASCRRRRHQRCHRRRRRRVDAVVVDVGWRRQRWDGRRVVAVDFCLLLPLLVGLLVLNKTSVWSACVSKILTDILFYVRDIPQSTRTISGTNHIKWCE
jgi:hypothetical protein